MTGKKNKRKQQDQNDAGGYTEVEVRIPEIMTLDPPLLLYCNSPDSTSDCEHTRFATSLIDVAKYLE
jgi:hypothetical protein